MGTVEEDREERAQVAYMRELIELEKLMRGGRLR